MDILAFSDFFFGTLQCPSHTVRVVHKGIPFKGLLANVALDAPIKR